MNAVETIATMRAAPETVKADVRNLDAQEVEDSDVPQRIVRMESVISTVEGWHGLA
jgi:hypothetical protein